MRRPEIAVGAGALVLGVMMTIVHHDLDDPQRWLPDLLTGLVLLGAGLAAWKVRAAPGPGLLLVATSATWFLGAWPETVFWHRGPLVHLVLTYAGWRPRTRLDLVAVSIGYLSAFTAWGWAREASAVILCVGLVAVCAFGWARSGLVGRSERGVALVAALVLALTLLGGTVARAVVPGSEAVIPALGAYQLAVCGVAVLLLVRLPERSDSAVADLVTTLDAGGGMRDRLARGLGDPTLQLGFWSPEAAGYLSDDGVALDTAEPEGRTVTYVPEAGRPFAVLIHDPRTLQDPRVARAVAGATRLIDTQQELRTAVEAQVLQVNESRRRLVHVSDEQRRALALRLEAGPLRRLAEVQRLLDDPAVGPAEVLDARRQVTQTVEALAVIAGGLHPDGLEQAGLGEALAALAGRSPLPVDVQCGVPAIPDDVATTAYFLCAESVTNALKHAGATQILIRAGMTAGGLAIRVEDDGVGGADVAGGTGLSGLVERVSALDGTFHVTSPRGQGTLVEAWLPVPAPRDPPAMSRP